MLNSKQLFDAMSAIYHRQEEELRDLAIADQQFPDSKGIAVHSFSFLFMQQEFMYLMNSDKPEQVQFAVMFT